MHLPICPGARVRRQRGFTLIEILIVVVILGILASVVIPAFAGAAADASNSTFAHDLKTYARTFAVQVHKGAAWPADEQPGVFPADMVGKLDAQQWTEPTPIGGRWDWDNDTFGYHAGVSVYRPARTEAQMVEIDRLLDDGNLDTGAFRRRTDGYVYILAEE